MKIDPSQIKPILKGKPKMQDPARFPEIQIPLETNVKRLYELQCNKMIVDITKKMVGFKK